MIASMNPKPFGMLAAEARAALASPTIAFPRSAPDSYGPGYYRFYENDCRVLMLRWLIATLPADNGTAPALTDRDAQVLAEHEATREIDRALNEFERKLMAECIRDIVCSRFTMRDAARANR